MITAIIVGAVLVVALGGAVAVYGLEADQIVRSTRVAGIDVGGLKPSAALDKVNAAWKNFYSSKLTFVAAEKTITMPIIDTTAGEDDGATELVSFDPTAAINQAYDFGHRGSWWEQLRLRVSGFIGRHHDFGVITVDTASIEETLRRQTEKLSITPVNAAITITAEGQPAVTADQSGQEADIHQAAATATRAAANLSLATINVATTPVEATFKKTAANENLAATDTADVQKRAPIKLTLADQSWTINRDKLNSLLGFRLNKENQIRVGFDYAKTAAYLETLRSSIDQDPREARFQVVGDQVTAFATSQTGRELEVAETIKRLNALLDETGASVQIVVTETKPTSETVAANNLGIKELVATATTKFTGSPTNRRYNLTLGAKKLNGLLIQPGETFSLIKALGKIDAANGWKSELVIKPGGIIKPEYGGGLCQVATTMFRVALNAGLPITERRNHSLRISYYEPPIGLDATIYEPSPDLKFTNDYSTPLLIQTEVSGNNLTFRFYGTKDGRKVTLPTPKVYNRTAIPATKTIEVTDLKPGQKVCQSPGHPGADATATYTVTKADGTKKTQVFQSHYMAIGVICRVGVKVKTSTNTNTNKSTTNTNTSTNTNTTTDTNTPTNTNTPANTNTSPDTNTPANTNS